MNSAAVIFKTVSRLSTGHELNQLQELLLYNCPPFEVKSFAFRDKQDSSLYVASAAVPINEEFGHFHY